MTLLRNSAIGIVKKYPNTKKIHFVTFGCESKVAPQDYTKSKFRLAKQAENTGWFSTITCYDDRTPVLVRHKKSFFGRVAGYGWWKPAIMLEMFNRTDIDDIIVYLDAGFNIFKEREKFFIDYIEHTLAHNFCAFSSKGTDYTERKYTKRDLLIHMNIDSEQYYHEHAMGGAFIATNNNFCKNIMQDFLSLYDHPHLLDDSLSKVAEHDDFIGHRHCQSILSVLCKKYNIPTLPNTSMSWLAEKGPQSPWTADRITDNCMKKLEWSADIKTLHQIREKVFTKFTSYGAQPEIYDNYYSEYKKLYNKNPPKHLVEESAFLMSRKNK